jgi:hypothetical protein
MHSVLTKHGDYFFHNLSFAILFSSFRFSFLRVYYFLWFYGVHGETGLGCVLVEISLGIFYGRVFIRCFRI